VRLHHVNGAQRQGLVTFKKKQCGGAPGEKAMSWMGNLSKKRIIMTRKVNTEMNKLGYPAGHVKTLATNPRDPRMNTNWLVEPHKWP
jgi:hypothetical protein